MAAQLDAARLRAALAGKDDPLAEFKPPQDASSDLIEMQRRFLLSQTAEQKAKLAAHRTARWRRRKLSAPPSRPRSTSSRPPFRRCRSGSTIREHLFNKELGSKLTYISPNCRIWSASSKRSWSSRAGYSESRRRDCRPESRRASKTVAEYERGLFDDLAKAEQKAAGLAQDVIKAEQRTSLQKLTAPVDGVVQQLAVHTIGGVVTPAQALMLIVPAESRLEIEAMVSNRDIGFVEAGQDAAIKVDTFNFTRYGLLHGKVLSVSQDAITARQAARQGRPTSRKARRTSSSEPKGQELIYAARVSLDRTQMEVEDKTRQSVARHGGDGRDQDRLAQHHQLSALATYSLQTREFAREMSLLSRAVAKIKVRPEKIEIDEFVIKYPGGSPEGISGAEPAGSTETVNIAADLAVRSHDVSARTGGVAAVSPVA